MGHDRHIGPAFPDRAIASLDTRGSPIFQGHLLGLSSVRVLIALLELVFLAETVT